MDSIAAMALETAAAKLGGLGKSQGRLDVILRMTSPFRHGRELITPFGLAIGERGWNTSGTRGMDPRCQRGILSLVSTERPDRTKLRVAAVSLDCADPAELADFYVRLLDGSVLWQRENSVGVSVDSLVLVLQRVPEYRPPTWPGAAIVHLDLTTGAEVIEPTQRAIALGARPADPQPDSRWRVLLDPAGHPFCITPFAPHAR